MNHLRQKLVICGLIAALAACSPRTDVTPKPAVAPQNAPKPSATRIPQPSRPVKQAGVVVLTDPAAIAVNKVAQQAFALMQQERKRTGNYSANPLATNLTLPMGASWQLENISAQTYKVRFTSDQVPEVAWLVTPAGVSTVQTQSDEIF